VIAMSPRTLVAAVLLPLVLAATGCTHSQKATTDPTTALAAAKRNLDATTGVHLTMSTPSLPQGVSGILAADGVATHDPAFRGNIKVLASGITAQVPVVAVGGKVYAKLPFVGWSKINPADYGAPDPGLLISSDQGIPAILAATTGLKAGDQIRGGTDNKEVLSTYTGTVPSTAVGHLIPGASGSFAATYAIADNGELRQASLTGVFYGGKPSMTYTLVLDDYGTSTDITAP